MAQTGLELFVPVITPFAADFSVDTDAFVTVCRAMLAAGADGLAPFGTTSEANSLTVEERMAGLEALIDAGIPADRLIPGTGCCALGNSIALCAHAVCLGCRGMLTLPPFYYKNVP
jgi:4-hydroxy-tetrahydrodipicolinate synthase